MYATMKRNDTHKSITFSPRQNHPFSVKRLEPVCHYCVNCVVFIWIKYLTRMSSNFTTSVFKYVNCRIIIITTLRSRVIKWIKQQRFFFIYGNLKTVSDIHDPLRFKPPKINILAWMRTGS